MKQSAGILLYRLQEKGPEILLAHPGGPFWAKKDIAAWSIPKGEPNEGEDLLQTAKREFAEETGQMVDGEFILLTSLKQKSGKLIHAWALKGDMDVNLLNSNTFEMEWPPKSGKTQAFQEIDKIQWFTPKEALEKIIPGQAGFITELEELLKK